MDISPAGLVGAVVGLGVGRIDAAAIAMPIRNSIDRIAKRDDKSMPSQRVINKVMKAVFVFTLLVFAGLGYGFGVSAAGRETRSGLRRGTAPPVARPKRAGKE